MANRERGEVDLVVGEKTYVLFPSTNAICELQTRTGKTYGQILDSIQRLDFASLRELVWMLLKKHHKKEFPTIDKAGDLMDDAGGLKGIRDALTEVLTLNSPDTNEEAKAGKDTPSRPLEAQAGTGDNSTSTDAASV